MIASGASPGEPKCGKKRGVWQALNCLSIRGTYWVIIAGASPGETKMWAAVRENDAFLHLCKQANLRVSWLISTTMLLRVYQSTITNRKHAKRIQRDNFVTFKNAVQSFLPTETDARRNHDVNENYKLLIPCRIENVA